MAKRVITTEEMTDDLDGSKADRTVTFAVDGTAYEMELSRRNAVEFEKALKPYVAAARRAGGRQPATAKRTATTPRKGRMGQFPPSGNAKAIRAWAAQNGLDVPARGRIPAAVRERYDAAH